MTRFGIAVTAICGMLLGLPAAQAQQPPLARTIHLEIGLNGEGDFTPYPRNLTLQAGELYRLEISNWSQGIRHIVMGPEFAQAVATGGIQNLPEQEESRISRLDTGISVAPSGGRVAVYFVPYKVGTYKLFCQDHDHTSAGMEVAVDIRL